MEKTNNLKTNLLYFVVQKCNFCLSLESVVKVIPLIYTEAIPGSPNYLVGLMNFSGESIALIDLALALGIKHESHYTLNTPILLCHHGEQKIGIIIDKVIDVIEVEKSSYQSNPEFNQKNSPYLASIILNNDLLVVLNIENIIKQVMNGIGTKYE
jgi:chemotaxis signal transduction protein